MVEKIIPPEHKRLVNYIVKQDRLLKKKKIREKQERKAKFFLEDVLHQNVDSDNEDEEK